MRSIISIAIFCLTLTTLHAATQPKFTIIPTTATSVVMKSTEVTTVQYVVTNKTEITRTLTMSPITTPGIIQITSGSGVCGNTFTLAQNQSCLLNIQLTALQLPVGVTVTPIKICKTITGTNNPDPFLCSQTSQNNNLEILRFPETARITVNTHTLNLTTNGVPGSIKVTNQSNSVTATNIAADLSKYPLSGNITQDASNCVSVAPKATCTIIFKAESTAISTTSMTIKGSNTTADTVNVTISDPNKAQITVSGSPLILTVGGSSGSLTITNNSTITANNISAKLSPSQLSSISQNSSNCQSVPPITSQPNNTCELVFTPKNKAMSSQTIPIYGTNTSKTTGTIAVNSSSQIPISIISGSPLALPANGTTTGTMVIQNNSDTIALNIQADLSAISSVSATYSNSCSALPAHETCTITFTPGTTVFGATNFTIAGTNTTTVTGTISVGSYLAYISNNTQINACEINLETGAINSTCNTIYNLSNISDVTGIAFNTEGTQIYMSTVEGQYIVICNVSDNGTWLSNCVYNSYPNNSQYNHGIAYNPTNGLVYLPNTYSNGNNTGTVETCSVTNNSTTCSSSSTVFDEPYNLVFNSDGSLAYVLNNNNSGVGSVSSCSVESDGILDQCITLEPLTSTSDFYGIVIDSANSYLYISNLTSNPQEPQVIQTNVPTAGATSFTHVYNNDTGFQDQSAMAIDPSSGYIYIIGSNGSDAVLIQCPINASNGNLDNCVTTGPPSINGAIAIALYPTP